MTRGASARSRAMIAFVTAADPLRPRRRLDAPELDELTAAAVEVLAAQPEVIAAYLYGSAARDEPAADLDIAVATRGPVTHRLLETIAAQLQARGAPRGPEIDVRSLYGAAPRFLFEVLRDGRRIYERDRGARIEFEARAMAAWLDFAPVWQRIRDRTREYWAGG